MEPNVSDISCLRIRHTQVCSVHRKHPSITRKNPIFFSSKSSERAKFFHQRSRSIHRSGSMAIGFSGPTNCPGFSKGKRHGSKQIWTVRSHRDRWQPVDISRIGVSGNRELSAHYTWKCRSDKLRSTLRTKPRVSAPGHIKRAGKGGDSLFIIVNNIWVVHIKDARHISTSYRHSGIHAVRSPHRFTPRNPKSRSSESA
jgi:hypothetical protein